MKFLRDLAYWYLNRTEPTSAVVNINRPWSNPTEYAIAGKQVNVSTNNVSLAIRSVANGFLVGSDGDSMSSWNYCQNTEDIARQVTLLVAQSTLRS